MGNDHDLIAMIHQGVHHQLFFALPQPVHNVWVHCSSVRHCLDAEAFEAPLLELVDGSGEDRAVQLMFYRCLRR